MCPLLEAHARRLTRQLNEELAIQGALLELAVQLRGRPQRRKVLRNALECRAAVRGIRRALRTLEAA